MREFATRSELVEGDADGEDVGAIVERFAFELRDIIRRQPLPGYVLSLEMEIGGRTLLAFEPLAPCGKPVDGLVLSGTRTIVPSGTRGSCYQEPKPALTSGNRRRIRALNLESNQESNFEERARDVENLIRDTARSLSVASKKSAPRGSSTPNPPTASDRADTVAPVMLLEGGKVLDKVKRVGLFPRVILYHHEPTAASRGHCLHPCRRRRFRL